MHPCIAGGVGMNKKPVVNIGVQRFDKLRKQGSFYIDKTDFIREWWETGSEVTLITRPRRFGKTLNMSMLECFFPGKWTVMYTMSLRQMERKTGTKQRLT